MKTVPQGPVREYVALLLRSLANWRKSAPPVRHDPAVYAEIISVWHRRYATLRQVNPNRFPV